MGAAKQLEMALTLERATVYNYKIEMFEGQSKFRDGNDFNNHWEQNMVKYKKHFNKGQLLILNIVRQHAFKVAGVCNATYRTIIKAYENTYGHEVHRQTVANVVQKAEKLGLITVYEGMRMIEGRGSRTANVLIFNRYEEVEYYAIARLKAQDEEIARLIEEQNAKMTTISKYAYNAQAWAEKKQANELKKAQQAHEAEQRANQATKVQTMQSRMRELLEAKKMVSDNATFNEYRMIMFSTIKKAMAADTRLTRSQAEELAFKAFQLMCSTNDKDIKKNRAALLVHHLKQQLLSVVGSYSQTEIMNNRAVALNKRTELVPEWFKKEEEEVNESDKTIDFEAERAKILAKLGRS